MHLRLRWVSTYEVLQVSFSSIFGLYMHVSMLGHTVACSMSNSLCLLNTLEKLSYPRFDNSGTVKPRLVESQPQVEWL